MFVNESNLAVETLGKTMCIVVDRATNWCPPGFPCIHGHCHNETPGVESMTFMCECDPGWVDFRCGTCCPKHCEHGSCSVVDSDSVNNGTKCECDWGYTGEYCETLMDAVRVGDLQCEYTVLALVECM